MIYFIQGKQSKLIKIGYTGGDGQSRLSQLQTGSPEELRLVATMDGGLETEKSLHETFLSFRARGEWFEPNAPLHQLICWLRAGGPTCDGKLIRKVYLAGKITRTTWRDEIAKDWSSTGCDLDGQSWSEVRLDIPVTSMSQLIGSVQCVGPFWASTLADHCCSASTIGDHASGDVEYRDSRSPGGDLIQAIGTDRSWVVDQALSAIESCDLLFAWIDQPDCYGTLAEIGYAVGRGKVVRVACKKMPELDQLWFANVMTGASIHSNARAAWDDVWNGVFARFRDYNDLILYHNETSASLSVWLPM